MSDIAAAPAQPAEPTAPIDATAAPVARPKALIDLNDKELFDWRMTGARPTEPVKDPSVPAPALKAEEPRAVSKRQEKINDYERRIAEQNELIARLEGQLKPPAAPRSEPRDPKAPISLEERIARPDVRQPPLSEADFYTQHAEAGVGDYADYRAAYRYAYNQLDEQRRRIASDAATTEQARVAKARTGLEDAAKADPAFTAKIAPLLSTLQTREQAKAEGKPLGPEHDFASALVRSEVAAKLLNHLSDHPEVMEKVRALESRTDVLTFFGRLEAKFLDSDSQPAPSPSPIPNTVTDAPDPPVVLGSRPGEPADTVVSALKRKDAGAYIREMNARDLAAARG